MRKWLEFNLIERPYFNPATNNIRTSIEGLTNRLESDKFTGGGKVMPDVSSLNVIQSFEFGLKWMVLVDNTEEAISSFVAKSESLSFQATPTVSQPYNFTVFDALQVANASVLAKLKADYGIPNDSTINGTTLEITIPEE